jgi:NTP pyrophosphatase (non-canonical NTP hydrolase)
LFDTHPNTPSKTNTNHLEEELGDVLAMIELLDSHKVISYSNVIQFKQRKFDKLRTWSEIDVDYRG